MAKRVTLNEIGRRAGVSPVAVSAALGLLSDKSSVRLSDEKARMIRRVASEMGYQPNLLARAFRTRRTRMVGVLFRVMANPLAVNYMIDCVHRELLGRDYHGFLSPYRSSIAILDENVRDLVAWQVDGLVLSHVFQTDDADGRWAELEAWLDKVGVPFVLIESNIATARPRPRAAVDLGAAYHAAATHLIELGHRRLAFIGDQRGKTSGRWDGVQRAAEAHPGVSARYVAPELDPALPPMHAMPVAVRLAARELAAAPDRPTGLICSNDQVAAAAIAGLADAGLTVPRDASVTGYDDSDTTLLTRPTLTSFSVPTEAVAAAAVEMLLHQIDHPGADPDARRFEATLVPRESTAPPPAE